MKEKAAYLRGLIEGLGIDETTKEGKVIKAMSELLCEMAQAIDGIDEDVTQAYDQINDLERSRVEVENFTRYDECFAPFALLAVLLAVAGFLLRQTWLRRLP